MGELKEFISEKEKTEPFTHLEKRLINKRDRVFIRDIQFVKKVDKNTAIKNFQTYKRTSIIQKRLFRKSIHKGIKEHYGKSGAIRTSSLQGEIKAFNPPGTEKQKAQQLEKKFGKIKFKRYVPLGGTSERYYDTQADTTISRRKFMEIKKKQEQKE
jgi:hypothetical protein